MINTEVFYRFHWFYPCHWSINRHLKEISCPQDPRVLPPPGVGRRKYSPQENIHHKKTFRALGETNPWTKTLREHLITYLLIKWQNKPSIKLNQTQKSPYQTQYQADRQGPMWPMKLQKTITYLSLYSGILKNRVTHTHLHLWVHKPCTRTQAKVGLYIQVF